MIYVSGGWEWCRTKARVLEEEREKLLNTPYIDQETMCRIAEIRKVMANIGDFAYDYREEIQDVAEKSPLCEKIRNEPFPVRFQLPNLDTYDGSSDPEDHLHAVKSVLQLQNASDALICRVFPTTLRGRARCWYYAMAPDSIFRFKTLAQAFLNRFARENRVSKQSDELWYVKQREGESLEDYLVRFNEMESDVNPLDDEVAIACLRQGLRDEQLKNNLSDYPAESFAEAKERVEKYIRGEGLIVKTDLSDEGKQRAETESYTSGEEYNVTEERSEKATKKRGGYQYRGGRKKGRAGNSYRPKWGSRY